MISRRAAASPGAAVPDFWGARQPRASPRRPRCRTSRSATVTGRSVVSTGFARPTIALSWSRYVRLRPGTDIPRLFFRLRILNLNPGWATHPEHSASKRTTPSAKHSSNGSVRLWKSVAACLRARLLLPSPMARVTDALGAPEATTIPVKQLPPPIQIRRGTLRIRGPRGFRADARRSDLSS